MSCTDNHLLCERCKGIYPDMAAHWRERHGERWRYDVSMVSVATLPCGHPGCDRAFGSDEARDTHRRVMNHGGTTAAVEPREEPSMAEATCPVPGCTKEPRHRGRHVGGGTLADVAKTAVGGGMAEKPKKPPTRGGYRGTAPRQPLERPTTRGAVTPKVGAQANGKVELDFAEARLVLQLLGGREIEGRTFADLTQVDLAAIGLGARLETMLAGEEQA